MPARPDHVPSLRNCRCDGRIREIAVQVTPTRASAPSLQIGSIRSRKHRSKQAENAHSVYLRTPGRRIAAHRSSPARSARVADARDCQCLVSFAAPTHPTHHPVEPRQHATSAWVWSSTPHGTGRELIGERRGENIHASSRSGNTGPCSDRQEAPKSPFGVERVKVRANLPSHNRNRQTARASPSGGRGGTGGIGTNWTEQDRRRPLRLELICNRSNVPVLPMEAGTHRDRSQTPRDGVSNLQGCTGNVFERLQHQLEAQVSTAWSARSSSVLSTGAPRPPGW